MSWIIQSDRPVYLQLMEQVKLKILSGEYAQGDKLPSVRDLAAEASVNPNTMQKALVELERSGLVTTNRTVGREITHDAEMITKMRHELASRTFHEFITQLKALGFNMEDVRRFITDNAS